MAYSSNQSRDANGKWTSGAAGEQSNRDAKRFPVAPHAGVRSMATHAGHEVAQLDRSGNLQITHGGRRRAVAESIARGVRADKGFARIK